MYAEESPTHIGLRSWGLTRFIVIMASYRAMVIRARRNGHYHGPEGISITSEFVTLEPRAADWKVVSDETVAGPRIGMITHQKRSSPVSYNMTLMMGDDR